MVDEKKAEQVELAARRLVGAIDCVSHWWAKGESFDVTQILEPWRELRVALGLSPCPPPDQAYPDPWEWEKPYGR